MTRSEWLRRLILWIAASWLLATGPVRAGEVETLESTEILRLRSGAELRGHSRTVEEGQLRWELSPGEEFLIPVEWIERIDLPSPPVTSPEPVEIPDEPESWMTQLPLAQTAMDAYEQLGKTAMTWTRRIQLGGNFVEGNAHTALVDLITEFERNTPEKSRQVDAGGQWSRNAGKQTANRWFVNSNFDWPLAPGAQWITFVTSKNEYNELQNLDYRGTVSSGLGYRFLFESKRRLIARFGPAFTVEVFHSPVKDRYTPDIFGELEVRWPLFERTTLEQKMRVQPSVLDFELVRVFSTTGLVIDLDERDRWKLRVGMQYTYNSQPNPGRVPSDYTSTLSLVYVRK